MSTVVITVLVTIYFCGIPLFLLGSIFGDLFYGMAGTVWGAKTKRTPGWVILLQAIMWPLLLVIEMFKTLVRWFGNLLLMLK